MAESSGIPLAGIEVMTADAEPVKLGPLIDRPTVLVLPRYYGCLPCRDYLRCVDERLGELEVRASPGAGTSP